MPQPINKLQLKKLYFSGLSMMQISKKILVSPNKIAYWMHKYKIPRRSINDALYQIYNPHGNPFKIKKIVSKKDILLFGLGLGIYWGEGNKANLYSVRVGTTDAQMILVFRRFLTQICGVPKEKFKYSLMVFKNASTDKARKFWSKTLQIKPNQLGKITQLKPLGKGTYKKVSEFGVCTIYVCNIKLKQWLMAELKTIQYNKDSLFKPT